MPVVGIVDLSWPLLNQDEATKRCGLCLWGEHKISRFFQYVVGKDPMDMQTNYQKLLEKGFSGGYRTPIQRPAPSYTNVFQVENASEADTQLAEFCGLAEFIPERTAIQGDLPSHWEMEISMLIKVKKHWVAGTIWDNKTMYRPIVG